MTEANRLKAAKERLLAMREEAVERILRQSGSPTIAAINAALGALDETLPEAEPASRAAVSDNGQTIRLTLFAETGAVAAVELEPVTAIGLASELIETGLLQLNRKCPDARSHAAASALSGCAAHDQPSPG
jgi:hypothetical protein